MVIKILRVAAGTKHYLSFSLGLIAKVWAFYEILHLHSTIAAIHVGPGPPPSVPPCYQPSGHDE